MNEFSTTLNGILDIPIHIRYRVISWGSPAVMPETAPSDPEIEWNIAEGKYGSYECAVIKSILFKAIDEAVWEHASAERNSLNEP